MIVNAKEKTWCVYVHIFPNEKYYVGITCQEPSRRWRNGKGYANSILISRAINKYGWDNIQHEIVAGGITRNEATNFEKLLIAKLQSNNIEYGYNITAGGDGSLGTKHTEEWKKNNSERMKGHVMSEQQRQALIEANKNKPKMFGEDNPFFGQKHDQESLEKISQAKKGKKLSDETRKRMSEGHKGRKFTPVRCVETGIEYKMLKEAERFTGIDASSIADVIYGRGKTAGGFHWEKI